MRNVIYLHTPHIKNKNFLKEDEQVEPAVRYSKVEYDKKHPNEWGQIHTRCTTYKILLGNLLQKGCVWCGGDLNLKKEKKAFPLECQAEVDIFYLECIQCLSSGPKISLLNTPMGFDEEYIRKRLESDYFQRLPWKIEE